MPEDADKDAELFAGQVRASRADFARIHDAEAAAWQGSGALPLHVLVQAARLAKPAAERAAAETDRYAFMLAFRQAAGGGWLNEFVVALVRSGALGVGSEGGDTTTRSRIAEIARPVGDSVELQAVTDPEDGFQDPLVVSRAFQLATRRVCEVLVDRGATSRGTGFLVGPQTVLTNWHVVRSLFGADGLTPVGNVEGRLSVRFDRLVGRTGARSMLVVKGIGVDACDPAYDKEIDGGTIAFGETPAWSGDQERLDFALIRLDAAVGVERGWYAILPDLWPKADRTVHLLQFPGQFAMRIASGKIVQFCDDTTRRRVRHKASSLGGSSGGLCLGFDGLTNSFRASALHQARVKPAGDPEKPEDVVNQAIPLAKIEPRIREAAQRLDRIAPISFLNATSGSGLAGAPVLGRVGFQNYIAELVAEKARIIAVRPPTMARSIGKSFSEKLLRSALDPAGHHIVTLAAGDIPSEARALAALILDRVEATTDRAPLPETTDAGTTETAWIADQLLLGPEGFGPRLAKAARGRLVWLVIDDLDLVDIPDAGGRRFLEALYQNIASVPALRIVLIGLMRDLQSINADHLRIDKLQGPPGFDEVREWLSRRFGSERNVDGDLVDCLTKIVMSVAGEGEARAEAIANAVRVHLDPHMPPPQTLLDLDGGAV